MKLPVDTLPPCPGLTNACSAPGGKLNPLPSCSVKIRIPGRAAATGGEIICSDAAIFCVSAPLLLGGGTGVLVPEVVGDLAGASGVMVDWEDEREKVLARGARCVSLSSV